MLLFFIALLAFVLRFYRLGDVPGSLEWDEVAIGYDAYSILKTGKDQFGEILPLTFRSLDDWKPPLYEYLTVAPVAFFGLNALSVRSPSAIVGTITSIMIYILVKKIYNKKYDILVEKIGLLASIFVALSPWHLQFSRAAFEVNISLTILIVAVTFFFFGLRRNSSWFFLSSVYFGASLFSYHSARILAPILFISLVSLFFKKLLNLQKYVILGCILIFAIFFAIFFPLVFSKRAQIRFLATNILSHRQVGKFLLPGQPEEFSSKQLLIDQNLGNQASGRVVHNRRLAFLDYDFATLFLKNYFSHFNPEFLFFKGDAPLHHAPGYGMLHAWDAPFFFIGMAVFFRHFLNRSSAILPIWLITAIIPAAITLQVPHSVRSEPVVPTIHIIVAIGFVMILWYLQRESRHLMIAMGCLILVPLMFNVLHYLHNYYVHTNFEVAEDWLYGRKEAALIADRLKISYDKVIVSTKLEQPHIFFLFYLGYDPYKYLAEGGTVSGGFLEEKNHFDKYFFQAIDFNELRKQKNLLIIGRVNEFPPDISSLMIISSPNGKEVIKIVQT